MAPNLDRSLDEILAMPRRPGRRRGNHPAVTSGIHKRPQRAVSQRAGASGPLGKVAAYKIVVSNLPYDVSENMIKEYFQSVAGPIRLATLNCGPDGRSRGMVTVEFTNPEHAARVAHKYNGVVVDNRPMKVELVVQPNTPANIRDRVGCPRSMKPKNIAKPGAKPATTGDRAGFRVGKRGGHRGSRRGNSKTAAELDEEMGDYFLNPSAVASTTVTTTAANGGDVGMEDTILVGAP